MWKTDLSSKVRLFLIRRKFLPIRKALLIIILTIPEAVAEGMVRVIIKEVMTEGTEVVTLKIALVIVTHREVIEVVAPREVIVVAPTAVALTVVTAPEEPTIFSTSNFPCCWANWGS